MVGVIRSAGRYSVAFNWTCLEQLVSLFSNIISVVKLKQYGVGRLGMDTNHSPNLGKLYFVLTKKKSDSASHIVFV